MFEKMVSDAMITVPNEIELLLKIQILKFQFSEKKKMDAVF